jgi:Cobalamin synthesis protein cobW C-terminal domain
MFIIGIGTAAIGRQLAAPAGSTSARRRMLPMPGTVQSLCACAHPQAVHELYELTEGAAWGDSGERSTRIVVIGCRLERTELEQSLQRCIA